MASKETRRMVLAASAACEDKKAEETRILELDPTDSGFTDFFLITSGTNERQTQAVADEVEFRLKREFGIYPNSVEGRRQGEWVLLDYVDFVVHIFLAERRAYYDIERLRKSAKPVDIASLKETLTEKTKAVRKKSVGVKEPATPKKSAVKKAPAKKLASVKKKATKDGGKSTAAKATKKKSPAKKSAKSTRKKS
jgi:ribosome-associated protein